MKTFSSLSELLNEIKAIETKNGVSFDMEIIEIQKYEGHVYDLEPYREEGALYFIYIHCEVEWSAELYLYEDGHVELVCFDMLLSEMFDELVEE